MNQEQFLRTISAIYDNGLAIIKLKNADYATDIDPFKNFRSAEMVGVDVEKAILVRVLDKLSRIGNLLDKEPSVVEESVEDALTDAINYLAILLAKRKSDKSNEMSNTPIPD
jgi:hypothetical protein